MNNKKLKFTILSILVLVIACLAILSGCGGDEDEGGDSNSPSTSSTEIYIEKQLQPRLLYVEGQDFDTSSGAITISKGDQITRVPFNDPSVTVTGYNKNTLGNQTLTVSYEGKSTTLVVAVIARMTVERIETEYFTYEKFNTSKGRVKIANDDATTSYVDMSDSSITVTSFDSTTAGNVNVTIKYTNGTNSYECTFPVTVYEPAEIDFKKPTKDEYFSHETELNLNGSYLQLKAAKPSTFKKSINITKDMISGYDPASVTEANKDVPVTQTITVSYANQQWSFGIDVLYSPVYVMESLAEKLGDVDSYLEIPEGKTISDITLPAGAGEAAKEAIQRYFDLLAVGAQDLVDADLVLDFARVAAFYININDYTKALNNLNGAFTIDKDGNRIYVGESEKALLDAIEVLDNYDSVFNTSAQLMRKINEEFGEDQFNTKYTISVLTSPLTDDATQSIVDELQHILDVYELLKDMPSGWRSELSDTDNFTTKYANDIIDVVFKISTRKSSLNDNYNAMQHARMYAVITNWRTDFFEIVYSYYYYAKPNGKDQIYSDLWGTVPAPGILEDFRTAFDSAYNYGYQLTEAYKQSPGSVTGADLYVYHYYYRKSLELSEQIKNSGNELYTTIYTALNLDAYINVYLNAPSTSLLGYYDFVGPLLDNENAKAVYDAYYTLLEIHATTGQIAATSENRAKVIALFDAMTALSPTELHWFISSTSFNYHSLGGAYLIFDNNGNWQKYWLGQIMYGFFLQELPKDSNVQSSFINLLKAMEVYATAQYNEDSLEKFKEFMLAAIESDNKITDETVKNQFHNLIGNAFNKYKNYYTILQTQNGKVTLSSDMSAKFDELYSILDEFNAILLDSQKMKNAAAYPALIALYQKANGIYEQILAAAKADGIIQTALDAHYYTVTSDDPDDSYTLSFTVDSYFYYVKSVLYGTLVSSGHLDYANEIGDILIELLPFFKAELNETVYEDIDDVIAIFRSLDDQELSAFYSINASTAYLNAINRYSEEKFDSQDDLNPGTAIDKINQILALYKEFNEMYAIATNGNYSENQRSIACTAMIAMYNQAKRLYADILVAANSDANIMNAVNFKIFSVTINENSQPVQGLLDDYIVYMRLTTASLLSSSEDLANAAKVENVQELLIKLTALLKAEATGTSYTGSDILELLAAFRALTPEEKYAFYLLQGNLALYAEVERYLEANLSDAAKTSNIISSLINAEIYYSLYELDNDDEQSLNTFKENIEKAMAVYESLTNEDKALLGNLYYNALVEKYNNLPKDEASAA